MKKPEERFVPGALTVARAFEGLTVSELAVQARLSRPLVSGIENGKVAPFNGALLAIADTLGFPLEFFFSETPTPDPGVLHFRKAARVPARAISHAQSSAGLFAKVVAACQEIARFRQSKIPRATVASPEDIESAAESFRTGLGQRLDTPIENAVAMVERSGAFVAARPIEDVPIDGFCWNLELVGAFDRAQQ